MGLGFGEAREALVRTYEVLPPTTLGGSRAFDGWPFTVEMASFTADNQRHESQCMGDHQGVESGEASRQSWHCGRFGSHDPRLRLRAGGRRSPFGPWGLHDTRSRPLLSRGGAAVPPKDLQLREVLVKETPEELKKPPPLNLFRQRWAVFG